MSTYACPECGTTDVSRFHKNRSTESGLQTHCYKCQKLLWGDRHAKLERFRQHEREAEARETLELRDLLNERLDNFVNDCLNATTLDALASLEKRLPKLAEVEGREGQAQEALDFALELLIETQPVTYAPIIQIDFRQHRLAAVG
jgi:hypothetical protein